MKKLINLILLLLIILGQPVLAENFFIEKYDVHMNVDKNKTVDITEDIYANFTNKSHGILRKIPFKKASITNVSVSEKYSQTRTGQSITLRIGDPEHYVEGEKHYTIKYKYNYKDNKNEFYHNIIGTDWKVPINKVNFSITMPEKFDHNKAGLSIGKYGTKGFNGGAVFNIIDDIKISGETQRILQPKEGITFRVPVKKGYFIKHVNYFRDFILGLIILYTVINVLIWLIFGKDKHITPVVSFELPKGINALEAEYIYNDLASTKGIAALLMELVNKGYIDLEERKYNKRKSFVLKKIKSFEKKGTIEDNFINAIFENGKTATKEELEQSEFYYKECKEIIEKVNGEFDNEIYEPKSLSTNLKRIMLGNILNITGCIFFILFDYSFYPFTNWATYIFFGCLYLTMIIEEMDDSTGIWLALVCFFGVSWLGSDGYLALNSPIDLLFSIVLLAISIICALNLPKKSANGVRLTGELIGLKKYIQTAEKHDLELLAEKEPKHFYNILPYAYILGITDVWMRKFQDIMPKYPEEYSSSLYDVSNFINIANSIDNLSKSTYANSGYSSDDEDSDSKSYSHTSSSGGGGYAGGGGGGGGGSSW